MMPEGQLETVFDAYHKHFQDMADVIEGLSFDRVPPGRMFVRRMGHTFYKTMADYMEQHREEFIAESEPAKRVPKAAE